jgi:hypothetical protein
MLADGARGNGSTDPSAAAAFGARCANAVPIRMSSAAPATRAHFDALRKCFIEVSISSASRQSMSA